MNERPEYTDQDFFARGEAIRLLENRGVTSVSATFDRFFDGGLSVAEISTIAEAAITKTSNDYPECGNPSAMVFTIWTRVCQQRINVANLGAPAPTMTTAEADAELRQVRERHAKQAESESDAFGAPGKFGTVGGKYATTTTEERIAARNAAHQRTLEVVARRKKHA